MKDDLDQLHVRPVLRFAFAVKGRPTVLTKRAAYQGAVRAAVARQCTCSHGSDYTEPCDYHAAIHGYAPRPAEVSRA